MQSIIFPLLGIAGSLGLFIFSIFAFNKLIAKHTGDKLKNLLQALTSNPYKGLAFGFISSAIIQSSSALTTLLAALADTGMISVYNSLGVIFGANVGTTITAQLIAFDFAKLSPFIILLGLLMWFGNKTVREYGKIVACFGLLFLAIYLMSYFVLQIDKGLITNYVSYISNIYIAIGVGILASLFFQSSSVVTGLVLVLAGVGHVDLMQSVGLILGANIGTTSTVILASLALGREAKKVALAQFLFNFLGVIIILPFISIFYNLVIWLDGDVVHQVANIHLLFNLTCAIIFTLAIKPFSMLINRLAR